MRKLITLIAALAVFTSLFAAPAVAADDTTVWDIANSSREDNRRYRQFDRNDGDFDILRAAIKVAGLKGALDGDLQNYTVFAPTDGAFKDTARALCGRWAGRSEFGATLCLLYKLGRSGIGDVLQYHVVPGAQVPSSAVIGNSLNPETLLGPTLDIDGVALTVNGNNLVVEALDIQAPGSQAVVHVIDGVLIP
jgi:uncharacterized surface protein with fasciclin (FAS1) repeats